MASETFEAAVEEFAAAAHDCGEYWGDDKTERCDDARAYLLAAHAAAVAEAEARGRAAALTDAEARALVDEVIDARDERAVTKWKGRAYFDADARLTAARARLIAALTGGAS